MSKTTKELNKTIQSRQRSISGCEESAIIIDSILSMTKILKRTLNKVYPDNDDTKNFSVSLLAMVADLTSIKSELQDVASEAADDIHKCEELIKKEEGLTPEE